MFLYNYIFWVFINMFLIREWLNLEYGIKDKVIFKMLILLFVIMCVIMGIWGFLGMMVCVVVSVGLKVWFCILIVVILFIFV